MAVNFDIGELFKDIDKLIDVAAATAAGTNRAKEKELLTAVVEQMRVARAGAAELLPKAAEGLKGLAEGGLARAEQAQAEIAAALRELEGLKAAAAARAAKAAAPAAGPPAPAPGVDPGLGARLRAELLGGLGVPADGRSGPAAPGKDIWEDWK